MQPGSFAIFTTNDRKVLAVAGRVEIVRELEASELIGNPGRMFEIRNTVTGASCEAFADELTEEE